MKKKNITIDHLAGMVNKGFEETNKKMERGFKEVDKRFDIVDKRLDKIENVLLRQHSEEIEYLKRRVGKLEDALAIE